jgi:hypothetical protein
MRMAHMLMRAHERRGIIIMIAGVLALSGCGSGATKTVTVRQGTTSQTAATVPTTGATAATTQASPTQTAVHIYAPYSAEGKLIIPVSKTSAGSCFTGSIISQRSDAWRCMEGNELQDPCFAAALDSHSVVCPENGPWSGQVILITLAKGLPSSGANILRDNNPSKPPLTDPAWAIELVGGQHCVFLAGTSSIVAELRDDYSCTGGLSLFGNESRTTEPWTIFGRHGSTGQLTPETIKSIWF